MVALTEEAKFIALRYYAFRNKNFNEPFDGIIYAVYISMGFAFVNILYVSQGGMQVAILRTFTAVPAHAMFAVMMGYYAGLASLLPMIAREIACSLEAFLWPSYFMEPTTTSFLRAI